MGGGNLRLKERSIFYDMSWRNALSLREEDRSLRDCKCSLTDHRGTLHIREAVCGRGQLCLDSSVLEESSTVPATEDKQTMGDALEYTKVDE